MACIRTRKLPIVLESTSKQPSGTAQGRPRVSRGLATAAPISLAILGLAAAAAPSARAACSESDGTYTCSGEITSGLSASASTTPLTVIQTDGSITGSGTGIQASNYGTGSTRISLAGAVTGIGGNGIAVLNFADSTDLVITQSAGAITGGGNGIQANNYGTGSTTISVAGTVTSGGSGSTGILVKNGTHATDLTVTQSAGTITAGSNGISATNNGMGATTISVAGTVVASNVYHVSNGVVVDNGRQATDLTVTQSAGSISGDLSGISATNSGTGATTITTAGTVSGTNTDGITVFNDTTTTGLTVTQSAGTITGGTNGISATNLAAGSTAITVAGTVTGGVGAGIATVENAGTPVTINLLGGANVSATSGTAIVSGNGNATVTLESGSNISGAVRLGNGSDTLTVIGTADIGGTSAILDGGNATDSSVADILGSSTAATNKLTFLGTSQTLTGANLLNWQTIKLDGSLVTLADGTLITGTGTNSDGSLQGLVLASGSTLSSLDTLSVTGDVSIDATSSLAQAAGGTITGNVTNAGLLYWINLGQTLTINGNYTGVSGSRLSLETYLAGDSSATDKLAVTGNASGSSTLIIRPVAGSPGAMTSTGIDVIQVGGSSTGTFVLADAVQAGAYQYVLKQGGNGGNAGDWYLVSNNQSQPIYRPGVGAYVSGQAVNAEEGFFSVGTFHERRGENTATDAQGRQTWVRPYYLNFSADGKNRFSYSGAELYGVQAGQDLWATTTEAGTSVRAAFLFDYTRTDVDFTDRLRPLVGLQARVGSMNAESVSIGGTYSRAAANGAYLDVMGKLSILRNRYGVVDTGTTYQNGVRGTVSVEVGKPFAVGWGWQIEPQAQAIYLHTAYSAFSDSVSSISGYDANALRGRVGARLSNPHLLSNDGRIQVYGVVDVLHDFLEPAKLTIGGTKVSDDYRHTGFDVGVGGEFKVSRATSLYGRGLYTAAFESGESEGYLFFAGLKTQF